MLSGEELAIARMISRIESGSVELGELRQLYSAGGKAHVVGVTGAPGSGKSTLVAALAGRFLARGLSVGIIAVDPTSPYTGGALLGDRIRMQSLFGDPRVFIRSMATRGALGGLARATADAVAVLDAAGKDVVVVETVGVGQDEVDVARASHTTVVVTVPGLGDDVQAIKAGVIEIADIHVVNKADRDGAARTAAELRTMLNLAGPRPPGAWRPPILMTVAETGQGVEELAQEIERHRNWLEESGCRRQREREIAAARVRAVAMGLLLARLQDPTSGVDFEEVVDRVAERELDPTSAAWQLMGGVESR